MRLVSRIVAPLVFIFTMLLPSGAAVATPAEVIHEYDDHFSLNLCNGKKCGLRTCDSRFKAQNDGSVRGTVSQYGEGVGSLGNEYVYSNVGHRHAEGESFTTVNTIVLVSKGTAPNQLVKARVSFTPT